MKTKITRLLLSAALLMCCTVMAWADLGTPPNNEIWYTTDNNSKLTAGKYDVGKELCGSTISEHGESDGHYYIKFNANIEYIGENDFDNEDHITEVSLPNTITSIRDKAFNDCDGLVTFHMPNSVINLGYCAFYHCNKLKNLTLGSGLKYIGSYGEKYGVFEECDALEAIAIPASVTLLGQNAFYDCDKLKFVAIGSGVTSITEQAFYNCNELMSVAIDGNGVSIGEDAFNDCEKLESVSFFGNTPPSSFGDDCFYDCSPSLKYHVLEENYVRYNGNSYLSGKVVAGPPYNEIWYTTNNGGTAGETVNGNPPALNAYMGSHGVQFFNGNPPEFSSTYSCFDNCYNLVSAVLPPSITYIGPRAFCGCNSLVSVSIPSTVTGIGEYAFYVCTSLQDIKLPDGLNSIGKNAFDICRSLQSITIPQGVSGIPEEAFSNCTGLRSVTILGTISGIGQKAFYNCTNLSEIYYLGDGTPEMGDKCFNFCPATIYVKDVAGHGNWGDRKVLSWRSGRGDGSAASPLEIGNYQQLYGFSLEVEYMNGANLCAKLTNDITGSTNVLNEDGTPKGVFKQWLPIGSWGSVPNTYNGYTGEFDGGGHTVSGLYFNDVTKAPAGLFGMADGAYIHDVGVKDSYFRGKSHVAGICGDLASGRMENCWNAATVQSVNGTSGGMAGSCWRSASMSGCHNTGKVAEGAFCGGVCGSVAKNTAGVTNSVSNCVSLEGKCSVAYNLYESGVGIHNVSIKNASAFASGEVCYILNGYQTSFSDKWRQQLGVDGYPTLSGDYFVYYSARTNKYYNYDDNIFGSGTADDPYRIGNWFELLMFADIVNNGNTSACGVLTADITVNNGVLDSSGDLNNGTFEIWTPIGSWGSEPNTYKGFAGEFNGNGHTISGLYFNDETKAPVGLFGMADQNGYIHDVGITDSYSRAKSHVAGICGDLAYGRIENCWNGATVIGNGDNSCAGGIAGSCGIDASVNGCYNIGMISVGTGSNSQCGGICGTVAKNNDPTVYSVSNCVSLKGKCSVAYNLYDDANIHNVLIKDAEEFADGEACWILNGNQRSATWRQLLGTDNYPMVTGDYLIYYDDGEREYLNETMCDHTTDHLHTFELKTMTQGSSIIKYWHCTSCGKDYQYYNRMNELPGTECTEPSAGDGSQANPYQIATLGNLLWFADHVNSGNASACAILTADITMNTNVLDSDGRSNGENFVAWSPIGGHGVDYSGEFNGNGHTISGLFFKNTETNNVGLFGKANDGAYIHDLGIRDSYFYGHDHVGGICGDFASGRIENCWNGAYVMAHDYDAGGISGSCYFNASIANCYNIGIVSTYESKVGAQGVTQNEKFGGICGSVYNSSATYSIDNCYTLKSRSIPRDGDPYEGLPHVSGDCDKIYGFLVDNCPASKIHDSYVKDAAAFVGGEVCYRLNRGVTDGSQKWYQTLESDLSPVLDNKHTTVYRSKHDEIYTNLLAYHVPRDATFDAVGFTEECWENVISGKLYADKDCQTELNPTCVIYQKLPLSPVQFAQYLNVYETVTYENCQFYWAAEKKFDHTIGGTYNVQFIVRSTDISNARIKWYKSQQHTGYGIFTINVYVNNEIVNTRTDDGHMGGVMEFSLPGLKKDDVVKFEINKPIAFAWDDVTIAACLEYTREKERVTIKADDKIKIKGADDPELTWQVADYPGDYKPTGFTLTREEGEEPGTYAIHASQLEGANPDFDITFEDGTFTIIEGIHHEKVEPTIDKCGFAQDCWEETSTGKLYADPYLKTELNPVKVATYLKLSQNPIVTTEGFTQHESASFCDCQFDWVAETRYINDGDTGTRFVEFMTRGTDIKNARIKWCQDHGPMYNSEFTIKVYVNNIEFYSNRGMMSDVMEIPLPGLKQKDIVKFEISNPSCGYTVGNVHVTIAACLEYTRTAEEGKRITANQDPNKKENYYATFYSSEYACQVQEGVTAYTGKVEGNVLRLREIEDGVIPAGEAVVLRLTTANTTETQMQITLTAITTTATKSETNKLEGTDVEKTLGAGQYALSLGQDGVGFYLWENRPIGANKAYLTLVADGPSQAKAFTFMFDDGTTTGITSYDNDNDNGNMYNLNGIRVNENYKGIIIRNGKKIYQK